MSEEEKQRVDEGKLLRTPPSQFCRLCGRYPAVMKREKLCGFCWLKEWGQGRVSRPESRA